MPILFEPSCCNLSDCVPQQVMELLFVARVAKRHTILIVTELGKLEFQ